MQQISSKLITEMSTDFYCNMVDHLVDLGYWTSSNLTDFVGMYSGC